MTIPIDFHGPKHLHQELERLSKRLGNARPATEYDWDDLVERFSAGRELSLRDERKLCWALTAGKPPLFTRPSLERALNELQSQLEARRPSPLSGAIYCLINQKPVNDPGLRTVRQWVCRNLSLHGSSHAVLEHWNKHIPLFSDDGPAYLATLMTTATSYEEALTSCQIPPQSWLVRDALEPLAARSVEKRLEDRARLFSFVERHYSDSVAQTTNALLSKLRQVGVFRRVADIEYFFMKHLGHPSMDRKGLWATISQANRDLARKWLTEKNIRLFYDHLVKAGDKHRLHFWLQFLDEVDDVRIVVGPDDAYTNNQEIRDALRNNEIARLNGRNANVSAIFLKIGRWRIVEFSQLKNATYAYTSDHKPETFWWAFNRYEINSLKEGVGWPHRVIHPSKALYEREWQMEFATRLRVALMYEFPPANFRPK